MDIHGSPEKFGLATIGEIEWSSGAYEFDLTVLWKRESDGRFVYAEDSGCSCPSPFEDKGIPDLTVLPKRGGLKEFQAHLADRQGDGRDDRAHAIAELVERARAAGLR